MSARVLVSILIWLLAGCGPPPPEDRSMGPVPLPSAEREAPPRAVEDFPSALGSALGGGVPAIAPLGTATSAGACLLSCRQAQAQCGMGCGFESDSCRQAERQSQLFDYRRYVEQSISRHEQPLRTLDSFPATGAECRATAQSCTIACSRAADSCARLCAR